MSPLSFPDPKSSKRNSLSRFGRRPGQTMHAWVLVQNVSKCLDQIRVIAKYFVLRDKIDTGNQITTPLSSQGQGGKDEPVRRGPLMPLSSLGWLPPDRE